MKRKLLSTLSALLVLTMFLGILAACGNVEEKPIETTVPDETQQTEQNSETVTDSESTTQVGSTTETDEESETKTHPLCG